MKITKYNVDTYIQGSVFFGTGGGLPGDLHQKIFQDLLDSTDEINAHPLEAFPDEAILVSAYGVGDPSKIPENFVDKVREGFAKYKKLTGIKIAGIVPGEIGAEGLAFQVGACVDLPIVDADLVGGRAAPEIQLDVFSVFGLPIVPVVLYAMNDKSIFLEGNFSAQEIEHISRNFFAQNGDSGFLIGYGMSAGEYKKYAMAGTLSQTMRAGELLHAKNSAGLVSLFDGKIMSEGVIEAVELKSQDGFLVGKIKLAGGVMEVKNENISFLQKNGSLVQAPDILILLADDGTPIHNTKIAAMVGQHVRLIYLPAQGYWNSVIGRELWELR